MRFPCMIGYDMLSIPITLPVADITLGTNTKQAHFVRMQVPGTSNTFDSTRIIIYCCKTFYRKEPTRTSGVLASTSTVARSQPYS